MHVADPNHILFDRSPQAVLVLNRDGQVSHANREACRTLSTNLEKLVNRPILGSVVPDDRDRVKELFLRVLGGQEREWISRFRRGDGVTRVKWVRAVPLEHGGEIGGIVMFARDITESRAGRPETIQLQTLLENLPGQLVVVADSSGRIRYSSGLSRTHFLDDVDSLGMDFADLLEPDEENERLYSQMLHEVVSEGRDWAGTQRHRRVDGTPLPVRTFASPYLDPRHGRVMGMLIVGSDVSAEHDWRDRARRSQRLAGVGRLVARVAGEIDECIGRIDSANDPGVELQRLRSITSSLTGFAADVHLERSRISLPVEAEAVLSEMESRFSDWEGITNLEIPEELPTAHADPAKVRKVLRILLENALESDNGSDAPAVTVSFSTTPASVCVRVQNSGARVDPDVVHRIFEPFFTTKPGHAGLGLASARGIVQAHGGDLRAEVDGETDGLTLVAEFPFEDPDATLRFRPAPLALARTRSVLVVDDEESVRRSIRRFLEKVGFEVREAWSGRSALAQITVGSPPELVLTDLMMADGSGSWFLDQLSNDFPDLLRHTVIVTGDTDVAEITRLARATGCPVLRKPLELAHLLDVLDEVALRS